jgi:GTP-binding protein
VGKSTLFNRIVGHRQAIVHDMPGVTRDRHYADADWAGKQFTLIDTGGYVPASEDVFEVAVREQVDIAIDQADVVIFVVDAGAGLLPGDEDIAGLLRRSSKPAILAVNKIDSERQEPSLAEFYRLGLGDPFPVSALVGRRIGDLLDLITRDIPSADSVPADPRLKIAVIGKPNVGKSSFVNSLLQETRHIVTDIPGTTRDSIDAVLKYYGEEILLVDTAGLRRKGKIKESVELFSAVRTLKAIERCDVAVILIDAQQGLEHQDLRIIETVVEKRRPAMLAINKWDLIEKDDSTARMLESALRERLRIYDYLPIMFISALTKQRIYKVIDQAKGIREEAEKRIATSTLNEIMGGEIRAHPPKSVGGREVKINYVTQVKSGVPVFAFFCNEPKLLDDAYARFLENRIRQHFGFIGVPLVISFKKK